MAGDRPAGDHAIQQVLNRSSPPNLPTRTEKELVALASRIWKAEVTGHGREQWPDYFTGTPLRTLFWNVRVQAAIALATDSKDQHVEVRLVWAGSHGSGPVEDGRLGQVVLTRNRGHWTPVR